MQEQQDLWAETVDAYLGDLKARLNKVRELAQAMPHEPMLADPKLLHRLFREVHSLKGEASIMGVREVSAMAHELEDSLAALRDEGASFGEEEKARFLYAVEAISAVSISVIKRMKEERKVPIQCPGR